VQQGSHRELLAQEGIYRRVYELQAQIEQDVEVAVGVTRPADIEPAESGRDGRDIPIESPASGNGRDKQSVNGRAASERPWSTSSNGQDDGKESEANDTEDLSLLP
jgi:hypothetical protein